MKCFFTSIRTCLIVSLFLALSHSAAAEIISQNVPYLSLQEIASRLNMKFEWVVPQKTARLKSQWTTLEFRIHKRDATLNQTKVFLGKPILLHQGKLHVSRRDFDLTLSPLLTPQIFPNPPKLYHIVIDAGHGGKDVGTQNTRLGLKEKDLTLDMALRLKRSLESHGYKVSLTRADNRFVKLEDRTLIANKLKADLFISLHLNAAANPRAYGIETFAMPLSSHPPTSRDKTVAGDKTHHPANAKDPWNALVCYHVQNALCSHTGARDRGCKRARFVVLKALNCPGILIEGGFLTHPTEGQRLGSATYREKLVQAITKGVLGYQKTLDRVRGRS